MKIKVLLADDHKIVLDGLRTLLQKETDLIVVAEASDGRAAVQCARELSPDVVILDMSMPNLNGAEAARQILAHHPATRVVILSMHSDRRFVERALRAGAAGYLLKDCAFEELTRAVRVVLEGKTYLSPAISSVVIADYVKRPTAVRGPNALALSQREVEVLQLIAEGNNTKEIAAALHVSVKTVETHRQQIMQKLSLHSVAELTKYAIREGWTTLED